MNTLEYLFKFSIARPAPRTTAVNGSSATCTGRLVSILMRSSSPFNNAPPPVNITPLSRMSAESSGGVLSSVCLTASTIWEIFSFNASLISTELTSTVLGIPPTRSRPLT